MHTSEVSLFLSVNIDKSYYENLQIKPVIIEELCDLKVGTLLINYPTIFLQKKAYKPLPNDAVFLITRITELGVKGLILNPFVCFL